MWHPWAVGLKARVFMENGSLVWLLWQRRDFDRLIMGKITAKPLQYFDKIFIEMILE